jgi:hypothetical protein
MKWLVVWIALSWFTVPCDNGPSVVTDEYGRDHISMVTTLEHCMDSSEREMQREFDSLEAAQDFVQELQRIEDEGWMQDFKNIRIETTTPTGN